MEDNRLIRLMVLGGLLWTRRSLIALGTVAGAVLGVVCALVMPPTFVSRATIFPKEISATAEKSVIGVGAMLNPVRGSHLNRVDIVLNSPELAEDVIRKNELLPVLVPERWDEAGRRWKGAAPPMYEGVLRLRRQLMSRVDDYRLVLEVKARASDARTAHRILKGYLDALNQRLKESVIRDAEANRDYLQSQMEKTYDPVMREKLQQLILNRIETAMLLNANAFEILEGPIYPQMRQSPRRKRIVLMFTAGAFALSCAAVLLAAAVRNGKAQARGA